MYVELITRLVRAKEILQELVGDVRARYISCLTSRKWAGRITAKVETMLVHLAPTQKNLPLAPLPPPPIDKLLHNVRYSLPQCRKVVSDNFMKMS